MSSSVSEATDPLEVYDELVLAGDKPDLREFCDRYPDQLDLGNRIAALEALRAELDGVASDLFRGSDDEWPAEIGGFCLIERVGRGGMGVVFVGENIATKKRCAVKLLASRSALALERFRREARVIHALSHPGIPAAIDFGVVEGQAFLVTELVLGTSLGELLLESHGMMPIASKEPLTCSPRKLLPLDLNGLVRIVWSVADTLAYAHERGVLHRDVKPANIMITDRGATKLIDFGLAFESGAEERLTNTGMFVGSVSYAAPEQLCGDKAAIGPWTDTYALGATLFELLTHEVPFPGKDPGEREKLQIGARERNAQVPRSLARIVKQALQSNAKKRFQDGGALAQALRKWLGSDF